jgi:hypothetical protein
MAVTLRYYFLRLRSPLGERKLAQKGENAPENFSRTRNRRKGRKTCMRELLTNAEPAQRDENVHARPSHERETGAKG